MSAKRKRVEEIEDGGGSGSDAGGEQPTTGTFARAFAAVMKRVIAPERDAVLAKRKTLVQKQVERDNISSKAASDLRKQRKASRVAQLVIPTPDVQGYERQLKKVATKGGMLTS
jgi:hypothetical protein